MIISATDRSAEGSGKRPVGGLLVLVAVALGVARRLVMGTAGWGSLVLPTRTGEGSGSARAIRSHQDLEYTGDAIVLDQSMTNIGLRLSANASEFDGYDIAGRTYRCI